MTIKFRQYYKFKNVKKNFLCALCRAPRQMRYTKSLSLKNYAQLAVLNLSLVWVLYPWFGFRSIIIGPIIWMCAEFVNKLLYRKEISCPHCGFDATWYRRDVKVARQKVEEFWKKNYPDLVSRRESLVKSIEEEQNEGVKNDKVDPSAAVSV